MLVHHLVEQYLNLTWKVAFLHYSCHIISFSYCLSIKFKYLLAEALGGLNSIMQNPETLHPDYLPAHAAAVSALGKICLYHHEELNEVSTHTSCILHLWWNQTFFNIKSWKSCKFHSLMPTKENSQKSNCGFLMAIHWPPKTSSFWSNLLILLVIIEQEFGIWISHLPIMNDLYQARVVHNQLCLMVNK